MKEKEDPKSQRDVITHMLAKILHKPTEAYVIYRIWNKLDDIRIRFVLQQFVKRDDGRAFADLYLPQINMLIEINEDYHSKEEQEERDKIRNEEISDIMKSDIRVIYAYDINTKKAVSIEDLNYRIDEVVNEIKLRIEKLGDKLEPCDYLIQQSTPDYYQKRGYLSVQSEDWLKTTDDIAAIFGTMPKHRGYLRAGGVELPEDENIFIWWPQPNHKLWGNNFSKDGKTIIEFNKDEIKNKKHYEGCLSKPQKRIVFLKEMAYGVLPAYKFVGVFELNKEKTIKQKKAIWERTADKYIFKK